MGKCALETFSLESDQILALELAKHDPFGRPEVVFGVCIALRDLVHPFSPKWPRSIWRRRGAKSRF